jgi:Pentapeptide repeats (8 copies)
VVNSQHLAELDKGVESWNQWRRENPDIIPDLRKVDLIGRDLRFVDFRSAKLNGARLNSICLASAKFHHADLGGANLSKSNLKFAEFIDSNLNKANLSGADLSEVCLRKANLCDANLSKAILKSAILCLTNISHANLSKADLSFANLRNANLQNANLSETRALAANLASANLTGICIQDCWNINYKTNFDNVLCDYVYISKGYGFTFKERHPKNRNFQAGEFTQQFQKASELKYYFFTNGIAEFSEFLTKIQQEHDDIVVDIQEIDPKNENEFRVGLEVLHEPNQENAKQINEQQLTLARINYEIQANHKLLELSKQQNAQLCEILRIAVQPPSINLSNISQKAKFMSNAQEFNNNLQGANLANFANQMCDNNARQQVNQHNYSSGEKSLADAAQEIQALLDQLSRIYPTDTMAAKIDFAKEAIERINNDSSLSQRILSALRSGSISALEQCLNHPAASFVMSAMEDWQKTRVQ